MADNEKKDHPPVDHSHPKGIVVGNTNTITSAASEIRAFNSQFLKVGLNLHLEVDKNGNIHASVPSPAKEPDKKHVEK